METGALISILREKNVKLSIENDRLKLRAPPGVLDAGLKAALTSHKEDILAGSVANFSRPRLGV